ncbi:MAG: universal stress protein [Desulfobacterales bacterium]|nr:universal stress protein [Desulfobacterales bacterium]
MRMRFHNVMCATDFSDFSNRTLPYGAAIAQEFGAKLYVCHIIDLTALTIYGEFQIDPVGQQDRIRQEADAQLRKMLAPHPIEWEPLIAVGQPATEIARLVEEKGIDLVISATRGRSGLKRLVLGSVTQRLMRILNCPLLAVQGAEPGPPGAGAARIRLKRILIGCDFSTDSALALNYGLSLAQEFEAELHLVHVVEPPVYEEFLSPSEQAEKFVLTDVVKEKLEGLVPEEARNWCSLKFGVLRGRPYEELVAYAMAHEIDMIVLGIRGYGMVKSLLMGSTTDRVVRNAPSPVLAVSSQSQKT